MCVWFGEDLPNHTSLSCTSTALVSVFVPVLVCSGLGLHCSMFLSGGVVMQSRHIPADRRVLFG